MLFGISRNSKEGWFQSDIKSLIKILQNKRSLQKLTGNVYKSGRAARDFV